MNADDTGPFSTEKWPLSILIPTYGRRKILWNTVKLLLPQLVKGDEILLVDQNSPPLNAALEWSGSNICILHMKKPSLTKARNLALKKAKNSFFLFLDDDILPEPDLLYQHRLALAENENRIYAGAVDQEDTPLVDGVGKLDLGDGNLINNFSRRSSGPVDMFAGGHVLIPAKLFSRTPVYHEGYRGNAEKEEVDFALRCRRLGIEIWFNHKARFYHLKSPGGCRSRAFQKRYFFDKVHNEGLFYGTHGSLLNMKRFFLRMKNLVEFFTRLDNEGRHQTGLVIQGCWHLMNGFLKGLWTRARNALPSS